MKELAAASGGDNGTDEDTRYPPVFYYEREFRPARQLAEGAEVEDLREGPEKVRLLEAVRVRPHGTQMQRHEAPHDPLRRPLVQVDVQQEGRPHGLRTDLKSIRSVCASTFSGLVLDVFGTERQ